MNLEKKTYKLLGIIVLVLAAFFGGVYKGHSDNTASSAVSTVDNKDTGKPLNVDFSLFWKAWALLKEKHVSGDKTTDDQKLYGAIKGLAESYGDPYTVFFPPQESKLFQSEISGNFEGVGMEVGVKDNILT